MEEHFHHTVLVVDDDYAVADCIAERLTRFGVTVTAADSGTVGLEKIKAALKPFSLIISDQQMPGMDGHEFLEKAREFMPESIRFLVSGHPTMDIIMDAVNRGAIHRYISKPLDTEEFFSTIRSGLFKYEVSLENEKLLFLAKEQNAKLYMLSCDLKEKAESHKNIIEQLDGELKKLTMAMEGTGGGKAMGKPMSLKDLPDFLKENELLTLENMNSFYMDLMGQLLMQFQDIAEKNGFSMLETIDGKE